MTLTCHRDDCQRKPWTWIQERGKHSHICFFHFILILISTFFQVLLYALIGLFQLFVVFFAILALSLFLAPYIL